MNLSFLTEIFAFIFAFLSACAGRILWILQSEWFWERGKTSHSLTLYFEEVWNFSPKIPVRLILLLPFFTTVNIHLTFIEEILILCKFSFCAFVWKSEVLRSILKAQDQVQFLTKIQITVYKLYYSVPILCLSFLFFP